MKSRYDYIFWAGILFWILENVYFGWNLTPHSGAERVCDDISQVLVALGAIGIIATGAAREYLERH